MYIRISCICKNSTASRLTFWLAIIRIDSNFDPA